MHAASRMKFLRIIPCMHMKSSGENVNIWNKICIIYWKPLASRVLALTDTGAKSANTISFTIRSGRKGGGVWGGGWGGGGGGTSAKRYSYHGKVLAAQKADCDVTLAEPCNRDPLFDHRKKSISFSCPPLSLPLNSSDWQASACHRLSPDPNGGHGSVVDTRHRFGHWQTFAL